MTRPHHSHESSSPVDRWLDETASAERDDPPSDPTAFLDRLQLHLRPLAPRPRLSPALALAAIVPLVLTLWLILGPTSPGLFSSGEELALIEDLDLLELLQDLTPDEIEALDPDLIDLYLDWDVVEELPVEVLENS